MNLTLVASGDGAALLIRDHVLPFVRERGTIEIQRDEVRLITLRSGPWEFEHWTPFNALSAREAFSPGYRHALTRQRSAPELPYGLAVWHEGAKVLSVLWDDGTAAEMIEFVRGPWEPAALAL